MDREREARRCQRLTDENILMMAQAAICLPGTPGVVVEVRRGMAVASREGRAVGRVAAVAVRPGSQQALCLILDHLPAEAGYQSVPVGWVQKVEGEMVVLSAPYARILALPDWHAR